MIGLFRYFRTPLTVRRSTFVTTFFFGALVSHHNLGKTLALSSGMGGAQADKQTVINSSAANMDNTDKTPQDLKLQWAGGRDVWPSVPQGNGFVSIQTKVKEGESQKASGVKSISDSSVVAVEWPDIVKNSILYGFGAYNPRGQTVADEINISQHEMLKDDIEKSIARFSSSIYWEAASIWDDSSSERGFIVAFPSKISEPSSDLDNNGTGAEGSIKLCKELAQKYDQGAIYKFEFVDGKKLVRETIAVLDEGTDAKVEIEIDQFTQTS